MAPISSACTASSSGRIEVSPSIHLATTNASAGTPTTIGGHQGVRQLNSSMLTVK